MEVEPLNQENEKHKKKGGKPSNSIWNDINRGDSVGFEKF